MRGEIGTSTPVLGLRPTRSSFWRTLKLPNEEIFTDSPSTNVEDISSNSKACPSVDDLGGEYSTGDILEKGNIYTNKKSDIAVSLEFISNYGLDNPMTRDFLLPYEEWLSNPANRN